MMVAGYYAHCSALDDCMGSLCATLDETGLTDNTLLVFFSDHGDMLGSQGQIRKQRPFGAPAIGCSRAKIIGAVAMHRDPATCHVPLSIRGGDSRSLLDLVPKARTYAETTLGAV